MNKVKLSKNCFIRDGEVIVQDDKNKEKAVFNSSKSYALLLMISSFVFNSEKFRSKKRSVISNFNFFAAILGAIVGVIM